MTISEPAPASPVRLSVRRPQVLDAAVRMLALGGDRAMTYRTVDTAAGVPPGTASNYFRTRDALLLATCRYIERQRRRTWDQLLAQYEPSNIRQLAKMLKAYLTDATSDTSRAGASAAVLAADITDRDSGAAQLICHLLHRQCQITRRRDLLTTPRLPIALTPIRWHRTVSDPAAGIAHSTP